MDKAREKQAQEKLKTLCAEHDMKPFNLENEKGRGLELVRRMCGLPHRNVGRNKRADKDDIAAYASALDDFWYDEEDKRPSQKQIQDAVVEQFDIKPEVSLHGKRSNPRETVRGAYNNLKKARKDEFEGYLNTPTDDDK